MKMKKQMFGADGSKSRIRINWQRFQEWQRWDEFPERVGNPPMTSDMMFWYSGDQYFIVHEYGKFKIVTDNWETVCANSNFLQLLMQPVDHWGGKSFRDLIEQLEFEN